ncbi:MAG: hypothetical protein GEU97_17380 [Actinophytocola sp.]|nr:hypothetical protein [Actinophytocola sp.]
MSGYQTQIEDLRGSARAARSASEQASDVRLASAFDGAGAAMPGSRSESLLFQAGNALGNDVAGWVTGADAYADDLAAAADRYSANEDAAAADFATQGGD